MVLVELPAGAVGSPLAQVREGWLEVGFGLVLGRLLGRLLLGGLLRLLGLLLLAFLLLGRGVGYRGGLGVLREGDGLPLLSWCGGVVVGTESLVLLLLRVGVLVVELLLLGWQFPLECAGRGRGN